MGILRIEYRINLLAILKLVFSFSLKFSTTCTVFLPPILIISIFKFSLKFCKKPPVKINVKLTRERNLCSYFANPHYDSRIFSARKFGSRGEYQREDFDEDPHFPKLISSLSVR